MYKQIFLYVQKVDLALKNNFKSILHMLTGRKLEKKLVFTNNVRDLMCKWLNIKHFILKQSYIAKALKVCGATPFDSVWKCTAQPLPSSTVIH